jgi:hypothetical protein
MYVNGLVIAIAVADADVVVVMLVGVAVVNVIRIHCKKCGVGGVVVKKYNETVVRFFILE